MRYLVRKNGEWGCSECGWKFVVPPEPPGKGLTEVVERLWRQRADEFAEHRCDHDVG